MFEVGDRVRHKYYGLGTVICIASDRRDMMPYGIELDDPDFSGHNCEGVVLKAGRHGTSGRCWWGSLKTLEVTNL